MILSAIWCWETQANFSKTTKLHKPVGQVQFVGPEKFTSAHYTKFAREIMLLLVNNVQPSQARQNFESMCMLFVIYTHVSTLHSYCLRMHSFSVNQKHVIFLHLHYCIDYTCTWGIIKKKLWVAVKMLFALVKRTGFFSPLLKLSLWNYCNTI